jgi:hypothetical protein
LNRFSSEFFDERFARQVGRRNPTSAREDQQAKTEKSAAVGFNGKGAWR